ncbi:MAG: YIP1 family protein [Clostridia bacterium]|nr:YIP1 family protein [Clostridia bacterium]
MTQLKKSLESRGIPAQTAEKYVTAMTNNMSSSQKEKIRDYTTAEEFSDLSDHLADAIKKKESIPEPVSPEPDVQNDEDAIPVRSSPERRAAVHTTPASRECLRTRAGNESTMQFSQIHSRVNPPKKDTQSQRRIHMENIHQKPVRAEEKKPSKKSADEEPLVYGPNGKKTFVILLIVLSPVILALLALILLIFGAMYVALTLLIAACVIGLFVSCTGAGAFAVAGLIYGAIKFFSIRPEGLYEIGLALAIIGAVTLVGWLLYHAAVHWLPKLYKYIGKLFLLVKDLLVSLFKKARRECYKL